MSRFATPLPPPTTSVPASVPHAINSNGIHEPSSMTADLLAPIQELATLSQILFASLAPASTRPPPPPSVHALIAADDALKAAVTRARAHQVKQRQIERLEDEVLALDARWRAVCAELEHERRELETIINEGNKRVESARHAKEAAVPMDELLAYAKAVSIFSAAPPGMSEPFDQRYAQITGVPLIFPPFPTDEKMALGHLGNQARLGRIGEAKPVGQPPELPAPIEEASGPVGRVQSYRPDVRPRVELADLDLDLNPDL